MREREHIPYRRRCGLTVVGVLLCLPATLFGGLMMDVMTLPAADSDVWRLASVGADRYAGGWHSLDAPIPEEMHRSMLFSPVSLRVSPQHLEMVGRATPIWQTPLAGHLSVMEQLLFSWALQVPAYAPERIRLVTTERMLLVPHQLRIALTQVAEPEDAE